MDALQAAQAKTGFLGLTEFYNALFALRLVTFGRMDQIQSNVILNAAPSSAIYSIHVYTKSYSCLYQTMLKLTTIESGSWCVFITLFVRNFNYRSTRFASVVWPDLSLILDCASLHALCRIQCLQFEKYVILFKYSMRRSIHSLVKYNFTSAKCGII